MERKGLPFPICVLTSEGCQLQTRLPLFIFPCQSVHFSKRMHNNHN